MIATKVNNTFQTIEAELQKQGYVIDKRLLEAAQLALNGKVKPHMSTRKLRNKIRNKNRRSI